MQFAPPRRRRSSENIVPMINVVFLLLIFFLMTAQIAPPDPFEITPPDSTGTDPAEGPALLLASDGRLAFRDARGEAAVLAALAGLDPHTPLLIRADARSEARQLAQLLPKLAALGLTDVSLVTGGRP